MMSRVRAGDLGKVIVAVVAIVCLTVLLVTKSIDPIVGVSSLTGISGLVLGGVGAAINGKSVAPIVGATTDDPNEVVTPRGRLRMVDPKEYAELVALRDGHYAREAILQRRQARRMRPGGPHLAERPDVGPPPAPRHMTPPDGTPPVLGYLPSTEARTVDLSSEGDPTFWQRQRSDDRPPA